MDLRKLEIFCAVCREGGYSPAARAMGLTQSAVSQQVRALERELQVALFEKGERTRPTAAGEYLAREGAVLLARMRDLVDGARGAAGQPSGKIRVGMIDVAATDLLPGVFTEFRRRHPQVTIASVVRPSDELVALVERGELDCAVVVSDDVSPRLLSREIYADSIVAVVPKGSPLVRADLSLEDLRGEPLIVYPSSSRSRRLIDDAFRRLGIVPAIALEMHYPAAILALVREGMGIALISELSARADRLRDEKIVPIRELTGARRIGIVTCRDRHLPPQTEAFVELIASERRGRSKKGATFSEGKR